MPQSNPVLSSEEFLSQSMGSEIEAGFAEFLEIWRSSESLRLQIIQFVQNQSLEPKKSDTCTTQGDTESTIGKRKAARTEAARSLLELGRISASYVAEHLDQSYAGLSRKELLVLLDRYKAGNRSLGTYLLVRAWKKQGNIDKPVDFRLRKITLSAIERSILENRADFFKELTNTIQFLRCEEYNENGHWDHDPGQWWQFHLLLYILEHPKEKYPMREFIKHFQNEVGGNGMPTSKTLRSFCRSHGIALDSTPGAPKKPKTEP